MTNRIRMRRRHKRHKQRTRDRNEANRYYWQLQEMTSAWTRLAEMIASMKILISTKLKIPEDILAQVSGETYTSSHAAVADVQRLCLDAPSSS